VPKTVDNDLDATDYTFGFDTAVGIATEAMDRLRTTGDAHNRCMVAEVMGRHVGWIALHSGMAAGAHAILIPEQNTSMEQLCAWVQSAYDRGRAPLVVVAEGFTLDGADEPHSERGLDAFGRPRLGGIGEMLAPMIEERTGIETRATTLGHIQRGGTPSAFDRVLATRLGMAAISAVDDGRWGEMVALRGTEIVRVPFEAALGFAVKLDKPDFIGRDALAAVTEPERLLRCLALSDPRAVALGSEPVRVGGDLLGRVTSGGYGYTVERSVAYAYVPAEHDVGTEIAVEIFGEWVAGEIAAEPLYDPRGERIRS